MVSLESISVCIQVQRSHEGPFCFSVGFVSQRLHVKHGNRKPALRGNFPVGLVLLWGLKRGDF